MIDTCIPSLLTMLLITVKIFSGQEKYKESYFLKTNKIIMEAIIINHKVNLGKISQQGGKSNLDLLI